MKLKKGEKIMVTTEALKLLYKKLGGDADVSDVTAISEMVDLIEDVAGSGGSGGGVVPAYTFNNGNVTCNMTFNDIHKAVFNGQCHYAIMIRETPLNGTEIAVFPTANINDNSAVFYILGAGGNGTTITELYSSTIIHSSDDTVVFMTMQKEL